MLVILLGSELALVVGINSHLHSRLVLRHASVAKAVKDIDVGHLRRLRGVLQHGIGSAGQDIRDLVHEERQEAVVTIAGHGNNVDDLIEVLTRTDSEGVAGSGLQREELGERVSSLDKLLNDARVEQLHSLARELRGHVHEQFTGHVHGVLEGDGVLVSAGNGTVGQLPNSVLKPLLVGAEVVEIGILAGVGLGEVTELLLQARDELRRQVATSLVPHSGKGIVEGAVEVDEHDEAVELVSESIVGIIVHGRKADGGLQSQRALALNSIGALGGVEEPVDATATSGLGSVELHVVLFLVHANHLNHSGGLAQVVPGLVVHLLAVIASEEEKVCGNGVEGDGVEVFVSLADLEGLFEEKMAGDDVGSGDHVEVEGVTGRHAHARLEHDKGAHGGHEAVGVAVLLHVENLLLDVATIEEGNLGVHVFEEEVRAVLDEVAGEQTRGGREAVGGRAGDAIDAILDLGGEAGLSLGFAKLADDLGARALGALLLGDGVVCAGELSGSAVAARVDAITLDLATMTGIASPLNGLSHGERVAAGDNNR